MSLIEDKVKRINLKTGARFMKTSQKKNKVYDQQHIWTDVISLKTKEILSRYSQLISVTKKGLVVQSKKEALSVSVKDFSKFLNCPVELFLSQYEIPFYGVITKINFIKKDVFEFYIDFMENTPLYYRECVTDLLN